MRHFLPVAISFLTSISHAQSDGFFKVWISTAEYRIENIYLGEIADDFIPLTWTDDELVPDSTAYKEKVRKDSIKKVRNVSKQTKSEIDTNYYSFYYDLLEIKKNGQVSYKSLGEDLRQTTWSKISNRQIRINFPEPLTAEIDSLNHLSITLFSEGKLQTKLLFEPLERSKPNLSEVDIYKELTNHSWSIIDPDSTKHQISTHLVLQKDSLSILLLKDDKKQFSDRGKWRLEEFAGHYFIFVRPSFIPYYFHINSYENQGESIRLTLDNYQVGADLFDSKYPQKVKFVMVAEKLPSISEYKTIRSNLLGKWNSINQAFPDESNQITSIKSSYLQYDLKVDGTALISFGGDELTDYGLVPINKTETRQWKLSIDGKFIIFNKAINNKQIAYITFLDQNTLEVSKIMKSINGQLIQNMVFHMVKEY